MSEGFGGATPRRGFLGRAAGALAAAVGLAAGRLEAAASVAGQQEHDKWLERLTGKHRQLFDFNAHNDGVGLIHMRNFIETYRSVYGARPEEINVVGTFYGSTTPLAWNDLVWEKYQVGAALNLLDPRSKNPITRNWFASPREGDPVFLNGGDGRRQHRQPRREGGDLSDVPQRVRSVERQAGAGRRRRGGAAGDPGESAAGRGGGAGDGDRGREGAAGRAHLYAHLRLRGKPIRSAGVGPAA